jgi:hypothetical protein
MTGETISELLKPFIGKSGTIFMVVSQNGQVGFTTAGNKGDRRRFLGELPDVQSLAGAWGPVKLISIFDEIDDFGPEASSAVSVAVHFKIDGKRFPEV